MKHFIKTFVLIALSGTALAQPIGPFTPDGNDLMRQQRWANNMGSNSYYLEACDVDGSTVWDNTGKLEHCANFPSYLQIDKSGTPWEWVIVGYDQALLDIMQLISDLSAVQSDMSSAQSAMASMDSAFGSLESRVDAVENDLMDKQDSSTAATDSEVSAALANYTTTSALTTLLSGKQATPTGTCNTAAYIRGDNSCQPFPSIPAAQVNSDWSAVSGIAQILNKPDVTNASSLTSGTLPDARLGNTGTAGTYSMVVTDAKGRVTSGTTSSISYITSPAINACTQYSTTRDTHVNYTYSGAITLVNAANVILETFTNNTCTTGGQEIMRDTFPNVLAIAQRLNVHGWVPANQWVKVSTTGAATITASTGQTRMP